MPPTGRQADFAGLRVAVIHYWFVTRRGGEKVVEEIAKLFPHADFFSHTVKPDAVGPAIDRERLRTTFIDRLPLASRAYKHYLPLMPIALEQLDLRGYDLVISSESGPAKGVIVPPGIPHVCYCHSPMRYIWDLRHEYMRRVPRLLRWPVGLLSHYMRQVDALAAKRVDRFVANSHFVASRIATYYGRASDVIYPPVDVEFFSGLPDQPREDFYLVAGELVGYKRADLAVEAASRLGRELIVVGEGEMASRLRKHASPRTRFVGRVSDAELRDYFARCRALLFPGVEDFGMVPVEAMAVGTPIIALGKGGLAETVEDGVSGVLFRDQTADALAMAIQRFESLSLDADTIRDGAKRFGRDVFRSRFGDVVRELVKRS